MLRNIRIDIISGMTHLIPHKNQWSDCPGRWILCFLLACSVSGCSIIEKSSQHDLDNGFYSMRSSGDSPMKVYINTDSGYFDVHRTENGAAQHKHIIRINPESTDSCGAIPFRLYKRSLDIDITTILMKYRFATPGLPAQLNTDFNGALYFGWRHDWYNFSQHRDPLGKYRVSKINRGFDFGLLGGLTSVQMSPFTTGGIGQREYNAPALQCGFAFFAESNAASFGLAVGYDYLLGSERNIWIYRNKPWLGFVVGLALN